MSSKLRRHGHSLGPSQRQLRVGETLRHALSEVLMREDFFEPDLEKAVRDKDVIMGLRIQKERINEDITINIDEYSKNYQINSELLKLANPDCILMHPGPVNKGIELSQNAYDSENSVINDQVKNGVAVRMAILTKYFST